MPNQQLTVFISSTCYDLADLRLELASYLQQHGFAVKLSEDPQSNFSVDPTISSIDSCLLNLESSDIVVAILDRRYGPSLGPPYGDKSATEVEIQQANRLSKPVLYFVRDLAFAEYGRWKQTKDITTTWIEAGKPEKAALWMEFFRKLSTLPSHRDRSNWIDLFRSVVDLKVLVLRRLIDSFPSRAALRPLAAERLVRLHLVPSASVSENTFYGRYQNVGIGPATDIVHGIASISLHESEAPNFQGGLPEGEYIVGVASPAFGYSVPRHFGTCVVYCEYSNRFGDRYRVERNLDRTATGPMKVEGPEKLFVFQPDFPVGEQWVDSRNVP